MHKIDISKGERRGEVSRQWAERSADERFTSLGELKAQVAKWRAESRVEETKPGAIRALYRDDAPGYLRLQVAGIEVDASHFGFGQVAALAGCPANYLRTLPGPLAAANINYGLLAAKQKPVGAYVRENGTKLLRGVTSLKYGRIFDEDVVDAVMKVAGNGTGDTRWKVPGCIDWSSEFGVSYNSEVDITKENTTLYASDRDVFLFLVDDRNPIEVGKLADGSPDLMFRGFYVWNSEIGSRTFGVATMYLRGVCQNRNLWGVEGFSEVTFKHTSGAPGRFAEECAPALKAYAETGASKLIEGVAAAKQRIVAKDEDERLEFLARYDFSQTKAKAMCEQAEAEEGHPPASVWDFSQAVTGFARKEAFQDRRLHLEIVAGRMLDKVAA